MNSGTSEKRLQVRRILLLFAIVLPLVVVVRVAFHRKSLSEVYMDRINAAAQRWRRAVQLGVGSPELTNALAALVSTNADVPLDDLAREKLLEVVHQWLAALQAGTYDAYMAFRRPDFCRFNSNTVAFANYCLRNRPADYESLPDAAKARLLFDVATTVRVESVASGSLELHLMRVFIPNDLHGLKRGEFLLRKYRGQLAGEHSHSPFGYYVQPADVLAEKGAVDLALLSTMLMSSGRRYAIPAHITFFWSPDEGWWKPMELFTGLINSVPGQKVEPRIAFF